MSSGIQSNFVAAVTRFDTAIVTFVGARRKRPVARFMLALTHAGDTESWFLQGLLLSLIHPMPGTVFAHIAVAALAASGVAQLLKRSWKRPPAPAPLSLDSSRPARCPTASASPLATPALPSPSPLRSRASERLAPSNSPSPAASDLRASISALTTRSMW